MIVQHFLVDDKQSTTKSREHMQLPLTKEGEDKDSAWRSKNASKPTTNIDSAPKIRQLPLNSIL